jgi:nucleotide-binding universal stress UspA family protein
MRILLATDGSRSATAALQTAIRLLNPVDRRADLLCVAPRRPSRSHAAGDAYERRIRDEMTRILECAKLALPRDAGVTDLLSEIGSPTGVILKRAKEYDLTVIGAKGRGATNDVGLGPVASRVVEHIPGPVLIARDLRGDGPIRVLIAVDGSTASLDAIQTLTSFVDLNSAEVCLMHVAETPWIELGVGEDWVTYSEEDKENSEVGTLEKELVLEGEGVIEQARDLFRAQRLSITTCLVEGNPANEILSEVERSQCDLVVVGASGARDLKHRILGSVSARVAWDANCSVLIAKGSE